MRDWMGVQVPAE